MAWRRNARRTGRNLSFRRRPRVHEPRKSGHWQRGQFALFPVNTVDGPTQAEFTTLILAQIFRNLGDSGLASDVSYTNQVKYLEIGGIVFDWGMLPFSSRGTTAFFQEELSAVAQLVIFSDRVGTDGNPAAPDANWFTNTTPVGVSTATEGQDEDQKFPTRVHYRHAVPITFGESTYSNGSNSGAGAFSAPARIRTQGSKSLRLRLRLDDEHCLCAALHLATDNTFPSEGMQIIVKMMLVGSIYYRVVF